eukprot:c3860_g1_i1.p1 GENE.c3860_g1_i1~~c3860_g1_i1.p1  ORF type:complete len:128 (+),score=39.97 c3860_g1_i1:28-411(+)
MAKGDERKKAEGRKKEKKAETPVTREVTVNIHKRIHGIGFKKRAPRAVDEIKKFARLLMKTEEVKIDQGLNKYVWSKGIKNVPFRVRVRLAKKLQENDDSEKKFVTVVSHVPGVTSFKGLTTQTVTD